MALLEALQQRNLERLPSVTQFVEDEVERALLEGSIDETIRKRFGGSLGGAALENRMGNVVRSAAGAAGPQGDAGRGGAEVQRPTSLMIGVTASGVTAVTEGGLRMGRTEAGVGGVTSASPEKGTAAPSEKGQEPAAQDAGFVKRVFSRLRR